MRALQSPWRWPLALGVACLLLMLLAGGAARLFPKGKLLDDADDRLGSPPLMVMPVVVIQPAEPVLEPEEEHERRSPEEQPDLELFESLWSGWVAVQVEDMHADEATPSPTLHLPTLDWSAAARAPADTSDIAILARALRMQNSDWERMKPWAMMGFYQRKAARYNAMKKSIFNQEWLGDEDLR